jgi:hypothetical protein
VQTQRWKLSLSRTLATAALTLRLCAAAQGASKYEVIHNFTGGADGAGNTGVIVDSAGNLFAASKEKVL